MSIHQSKGLEFPVVAVADLAKPFNVQDLRGEIILDEEFGLCPRVKPPQTGARYPSLPHWLAQRHQRRELLRRRIAAALRRHDPRPRHADFERRAFRRRNGKRSGQDRLP